nr:hypothetical protein BaRGS_009400 [Batillaria attramentaria]
MKCMSVVTLASGCTLVFMALSAMLSPISDLTSFQFMHYLSMISAKRFLTPPAIYVLGNCVPVGYWWSRVLSDISDVRFIYRPRPLITRDVNGGVYLDTDMILLRPLDPLLDRPLTMGLVDNNTGMGNALILAAKGSIFLRDWYANYRHFDPFSFHENGMWTALRMWKRDPSRVHMESERFYSPNWYEAELLFDRAGYDMSQSYAVHIWHRHAPIPTGPDQLLRLNTTLGEIFRRIYFGR